MSSLSESLEPIELSSEYNPKGRNGDKTRYGGISCGFEDESVTGPCRGGRRFRYGKAGVKISRGGGDIDNGEAADYSVSFSRVISALYLAQKKW